MWVSVTKHNRGDWGNVVQNRVGPVSQGNCVTGTMMNQEYSLYLRRQDLVRRILAVNDCATPHRYAGFLRLTAYLFDRLQPHGILASGGFDRGLWSEASSVEFGDADDIPSSLSCVFDALRIYILNLFTSGRDGDDEVAFWHNWTPAAVLRFARSVCATMASKAAVVKPAPPRSLRRRFRRVAVVQELSTKMMAESPSAVGAVKASSMAVQQLVKSSLPSAVREPEQQPEVPKCKSVSEQVEEKKRAEGLLLMCGLIEGRF